MVVVMVVFVCVCASVSVCIYHAFSECGCDDDKFGANIVIEPAAESAVVGKPYTHVL